MGCYQYLSGKSSLRGFGSGSFCDSSVSVALAEVSSSENDIADVDGADVDIKKDEQARNIEIIIEYSFIAEISIL